MNDKNVITIYVMAIVIVMLYLFAYYCGDDFVEDKKEVLIKEYVIEDGDTILIGTKKESDE